MSKKKNSHLNFLEKASPWAHNENSIWLGSLVSLQRNIEQFPFPGKLETERRRQIVQLISKALFDEKILNQPHLILAEEMDPLEKEFLVEHFLTTQSFLHTHAGEAFILDQEGSFLVTINLQDHLNLQMIDTKKDLEGAYEKIMQIETLLGKALHWSFSPQFGFLTANPLDCGTAFFCQTFLQIPALVYTDQLDVYIEEYEKDNISFTGLQGNPNELIGDLLVIRNTLSLGVTEEIILSQLQRVTSKILGDEEQARREMGAESDPVMKDHVSRAYAILSHSYQVDAIEALNSISLLKLGVDLGWVTGITLSTLNDLFIRCRRAHLLSEFSELPKKEEISHKRAEFIHEALKNVQLHL